MADQEGPPCFGVPLTVFLAAAAGGREFLVGGWSAVMSGHLPVEYLVRDAVRGHTAGGISGHLLRGARAGGLRRPDIKAVAAYMV